MTNITVMSDLHLDFGTLTDLPGGDILILAGDILEAGLIKDKNKYLDVYKKFFDEETSKYNQVLYVYGNHEFYGSEFTTKADELIRGILPMNITVLQDNFVKIDEVYFYGTTLWTDVDKGNPLTTIAVQSAMSDYKDIKTVNRKFGLLTEDTITEHHKSKALLIKFLEEHKDDKTVVITHHAPSFTSIENRFKGSYLSYAYASDLSDLILDNPQIAYWVHGHTHTVTNYNIGSTKVVSNPRGYAMYSQTNENYSKKFAIHP